MSESGGLRFLGMMTEDAYRVERIGKTDEEHAVTLVRAHADKAYSLCDASSFVVMERLHIPEAIAFDRHFRAYGRFTILSRAFQQLQRKFKHAADFGVTGPYSRARGDRFAQALRAHVENQATLVIQGTYRSELVTHCVNPQTGLNVMRDADNAFVSGWQLSPAQLTQVRTRGSL